VVAATGLLNILLAETDLKHVEHLCRRAKKFSLSQEIITVLLSYAVFIRTSRSASGWRHSF